MKRYLLLIMCLFSTFFVVQTGVLAASDYIILNDSVNIRKGPGTSYEKIRVGKNGEQFDLKKSEIVPDTVKNGSCNEGWYEIIYDSNQMGYVCSLYVTLKKAPTAEKPVTNPNSNCEKEMANAGFPSSYWSGLCSLQNAHPTWKFSAIQTGLDWTTAVEKESSCGKSLVQTSNSSYIDSSCNKGYGSWKTASQTAVAYYMDPRNFLSEQYIFQFEYLRYDKTYANIYPSTIKSILQSTSFYKYHEEKKNDLSVITNNAGSAANVNPVFLASRMRQELGTGESLKNLYSGVYKGYENYYNFYNIGVTDACATSSGTTYCGLSYAKNNGWNSPYNAIKGGADMLANSYIAVGQYTTYLQKFNVVPTNTTKLYLHQYMTNIAAPSSESRTAYTSYKNLNLLNQGFVFHIPVYYNMDDSITNSSNGATGSTTDDKVTTLPISTVLNSAGYKYGSGIITGIKPETGVEDIKASIEAVSGNNTVTITDAKGNAKTSGAVGTDFTIKIKNTTDTTTAKIVIKGDTSGDGKINALDLLQVQKSILGSYDLTEEQKKAGDASGDGKINALDLLQIQKSILGSYEIKQ